MANRNLNSARWGANDEYYTVWASDPPPQHRHAAPDHTRVTPSIATSPFVCVGKRSYLPC